MQYDKGVWASRGYANTPASQPPAVRAERMFAGIDSWEGDTNGKGGGTLKQLTDPAARKQVVDNIKLLLYSTDRSVSDSC